MLLAETASAAWPSPEGWLAFCQTALALLSIALLLGGYRLVRGPTLADRVIALDAITATGIGWLALFGSAYERRELIDIAVVLALVAFVATIGFARYLERKVTP